MLLDVVSVVTGVHDALLAEGYAVTSDTALGMPGMLAAIPQQLSHRLRPDPRGPGKQHARGMFRFWTDDQGRARLAEADSIAHVDVAGNVTDDYSRLWLLNRNDLLVPVMLDLIPPALRRESGRMSADWFRYAGGTESGAHQDGFGDIVVICVMARSGEGGQSFLTRDGKDVLRRVLAPGEILIFRDEMFHHGLTRLEPGASRDALIFIRLREA